MYNDVRSIGLEAKSILLAGRKLKIFARISNGFFLVNDQDEILFITDHSARGPLTLNIVGKVPHKEINNQESEISFLNNAITFHDFDWELGINESTEIWQPDIEPQPVLRAVFFKRCRLCSLSANQTKLSSESQWEQEYSNRKFVLAKSLKDRDQQRYQAALAALVGLGNGLTPAGDDFICGLFLANHYFGKPLYPILPLDKIHQEFLNTKGTATNTLSRSLMRCALSGSADERIIRCLAWLIKGEGDMGIIIEELHTYGSSSGMETLAGILTFIESRNVNC